MTEDRGLMEAMRHGIARSPHWLVVEREFRAARPQCLACDERECIQIHHSFPFHYAIALGRPDLELDARNLVALCESEDDRMAQDHHLLLGHLGDFRSGNLAVRADASGTYHGMKADAIRADAAWQREEHAGRLKPLDEMSAEERKSLRARMDVELPPDPDVLSRFGIVLTPA